MRVYLKDIDIKHLSAIGLDSLSFNKNMFYENRCEMFNINGNGSFAFNVQIKLLNNKLTINLYNDEQWEYTIYHNKYGIDKNCILMQSFLKQDKNGVTIHQGDIVRLYINGNYGNIFLPKISVDVMRYDKDSLEVIGNIFENKRLADVLFGRNCINKFNFESSKKDYIIPDEDKQEQELWFHGEKVSSDKYEELSRDKLEILYSFIDELVNFVEQRRSGSDCKCACEVECTCDTFVELEYEYDVVGECEITLNAGHDVIGDNFIACGNNLTLIKLDGVKFKCKVAELNSISLNIDDKIYSLQFRENDVDRVRKMLISCSDREEFSYSSKVSTFYPKKGRFFYITSPTDSFHCDEIIFVKSRWIRPFLLGKALLSVDIKDIISINWILRNGE